MASILDDDNAIITLSEFKSFLSDDIFDELNYDISYDNEIERLINAASIFANEHTGVQLLAREHTDYFDGDGTATMFLDNFPVSESADFTVWIDTDREYNDDDELDADDVIVYYGTGRIVLENDCFPKAPKSVKVTYTAGYTLANMPGDLKYAVSLIVEKFWKNKKDRLSGASSINIEGSSITLKENDIPQTAIDILDCYSRKRLACG